MWRLSVLLQLTITAAVFVLGVWASNRAEAVFRIKDARPIVIDEIVGMWISLIAVANSIPHFICAFFLFRLFDVVKPFPARQAERLKGGLGVMTDDVVAGIYANAALQVGLIIVRAVLGA
jgi:phosphatidylglycerophosphatase A